MGGDDLICWQRVHAIEVTGGRVIGSSRPGQPQHGLKKSCWLQARVKKMSHQKIFKRRHQIEINVLVTSNGIPLQIHNTSSNPNSYPPIPHCHRLRITTAYQAFSSSLQASTIAHRKSAFLFIMRKKGNPGNKPPPVQVCLPPRINTNAIQCNALHIASLTKKVEPDLCDDGLLATTRVLTIDSAILDGWCANLILFLLILIIVVLTLVSASWDPEAGLAIIQGSVLAGEIVSLSIALDVVAATLGESTSARGKGGGDLSVGSDPVGQSILAVLDDSLGRFISIICGASLTWCDRSIIDELQKVL